MDARRSLLLSLAQIDHAAQAGGDAPADTFPRADEAPVPAPALAAALSPQAEPVPTLADDGLATVALSPPPRHVPARHAHEASDIGTSTLTCKPRMVGFAPRPNMVNGLGEDPANDVPRPLGLGTTPYSSARPLGLGGVGGATPYSSRVAGRRLVAHSVLQPAADGTVPPGAVPIMPHGSLGGLASYGSGLQAAPLSTRSSLRSLTRRVATDVIVTPSPAVHYRRASAATAATGDAADHPRDYQILEWQTVAPEKAEEIKAENVRSQVESAYEAEQSRLWKTQTMNNRHLGTNLLSQRRLENALSPRSGVLSPLGGFERNHAISPLPPTLELDAIRPDLAHEAIDVEDESGVLKRDSALGEAVMGKDAGQLQRTLQLEKQKQLEIVTLPEQKPNVELPAAAAPPAAAAAPAPAKPKVKRSTRWLMAFKEKFQYFYVFFWLYAFPILICAFVPVEVLPVLFWIGTASIMFTNAWLSVEALGSLESWRRYGKLHRQRIPDGLPKSVAAIVSAYLPNEISILRDSLEAVLAMKLPLNTQLRVIVSHNGGKPAQIEALREIIEELADRVDEGVSLEEMNVVKSTSKAHNVNWAVKQLAADGQQPPDVVVLFDADHQPDENNLIYALHSMHKYKADLLQGRCCTARGSTIIAAEFDIVYGVNHSGGAIVRTFGFFGGTNGYWTYPLLSNMGMDESMLTEDVDSAFRSLGSGARVIYDPYVLSNEEAAPNLQALIKQRLRWAQGWSQVGVRHLALQCNPNMTVWQKIMIFMLLNWREVYYYLTPFILPAAIGYWLRTDTFGVSIPLAIVGGICIFLSPIFCLLAGWLVGTQRHPDLHARQYLEFMLVAPLYDTLKNHICVLGHIRNLLHMTAWVVTSRKAKAMPAGAAPMAVPTAAPVTVRIEASAPAAIDAPVKLLPPTPMSAAPMIMMHQVPPIAV